ncbi:MAG: hypothetical protein IKT17_09575 [Lachnospiraceae bacterium]|nr:hypothetical protein [Lachnospiraceae bacterium]
MKKRLGIVIVCLTVAMCLMITGCDKEKKPAATLMTEGDTIKPGEDDSQNDDTVMKPKTVSDEFDTSREQAKDKEKLNEEAEAAYMEFVSDDRLAVSDIEKQGWFRKGNRYGFSEIVNTYLSNEFTTEDMKECGLKDASYSYIDCGNNGSQEMVLQLKYMLPYGEWFLDYFLCYEDGEVHIMWDDEWGYRSDLTVNKYGYVTNGGSGGANRYSWDNYFFNGDNERVFLYSCNEVMGLATPMVEKYYLKDGWKRTDYPENEYATSGDGYTIYQYSLKEVKYEAEDDSDDMYEKYYKDYLYSFTDYNDKPVMPAPAMIEFYKKENVKWYDYEELKEKILKHQHMKGADDEIINADPVEWTSLADIIRYPLMEDEVEEDGTPEVTYYTILDDHPKPYLSPNAPSSTPYTPVKLKKISCVENEITDVDEWFAKAGTTKLGTDFDDGTYRYVLTGDAGYGTLTQINVYNKSDNTWLYHLDFSDFLYEDGYEGNDFVARGIHNCFMVGDLFYLNLYHRTYAETCPENAYMICVNITTGEVMWISDALVANSNSFVRWGDNIITGYGFTDEDDYIYILNRYNGAVNEKIKVKKSPDYFRFVDNDLWVRTYSYDYVFDILNN